MAGFRLHFRIVLLSLLILVSSGCGGNKAEKQLYPDQLVITIGSGGGAAGTWEGYTIEADRTLKKWKSQKGEDVSEKIAVMDKDDIELLWLKIDKIKFFDIKLQDPGNMTNKLEIATKDSVNLVLWNSMTKTGKVKELEELSMLIKEIIELKYNLLQ